MNLRDMLFRRRPPIYDAAALADFIDEHSAFVAQKGVFEYSRARAGHYAKVMFGEPEFIEAVDRSRWRAYPLGLAMVGELVEGALRPHAGEASVRQGDAVQVLALSVFDRYPTPKVLGERAWSEARIELARRLQLVGLHPPKRAFEIPEPFAQAYFDLMPIHKKLRASELPTLHGYLKATMCNIHEELTKRIDVAAVVTSLQESRGEAASHAQS
jgi:hypothetical protein